MAQFDDEFCLTCGDLLPLREEGRGRKRIYCSRKCQPSLQKACTICGVTFVARNVRTVSCSKACTAKLVSSSTTGRKRPARVRFCADCCIPVTTASCKMVRCETCKLIRMRAIDRLRYAATRPTTVLTRPCAECSVMVPTKARHIVLCADHKAERRRARDRRKNAVRRGAAVAGPAMSIEQLGDRDSWRCHLCRKHVDRTLVSPHPKSPTFDHLIPVSTGGTDEPSNLALAHRHCNVARGNRGTVQLLLVG